jgi:hypothetical protein
VRRIALLRLSTACLFLLTALVVHVAACRAAIQFTDVFVGDAEGPNGTPHFRIPALIVTSNGDLVAFAEARPTPNDPGEILGALNYLVSKVSTDGGLSWSPLKVVRSSDHFNYSDPRTYLDATTGTLFVQYTQWPDGGDSGNVPPGQGDDSSVAFYQASTDNGQSWNAPVNINSQVKDPSWSQTCNGPGVGIQLRWQSDSARNGRLVVPAFVNLAVPPATAVFRDASFYSDDHGLTWQASPVAPSGGVDESQIVELTNGDLLMDARPRTGPRLRFISHDGGATWESPFAGDVNVTRVNAGLIRYSARRDGDDRDRLFFSAPLGSPAGSGNNRDNIGVWTSYDEGKTFINPVSIDPEAIGGYSAIQKLNDGSLALLYEKTVSTQIALAKFSMHDLEGRRFSPDISAYDGFGNNIDRKRGGLGWSGSWTGPGSTTNSSATVFNGSSLGFAESVFPVQDGRADLTAGQNHLTRKLATTIDLNTNSTTYLAFLMSSALDTSVDGTTDEFLSLELRDASNINRARLGVNSSEAFFVDTLGDSRTTAADSQSRLSTYLVLAKIDAQDNSAPGNFDRISLKVFQSGTDSLPGTDESMEWTLLGSTNQNNDAVLDRLAFVSGSDVTWSVDEFRVGSTFSAVLHNTLTLPGDFNVDSSVDAADYVVWRKSFNDTFDLPNETTTPALATQEDYDVWRANHSASPDSASTAGSAFAVPEPVHLESLLLLIRPRRRRRPQLPRRHVAVSGCFAR